MQTLILVETGIADEGLAAIAEGLTSCSQLKKLDLSFNVFTVRGLKKLISSFNAQ